LEAQNEDELYRGRNGRRANGNWRRPKRPGFRFERSLVTFPVFAGAHVKLERVLCGPERRRRLGHDEPHSYDRHPGFRQVGAWVFGGEADLDWADIDGSKSFTLPLGGTPTSFSVLSRLEWLDTIRGRVGYIWGPQALLYLTGGAAYGSVTAQVPFAITGLGGGLAGFLGQADTRLGWTIGVGVEYMLMPQLTGKLEYLFVDLDTNTQLVVDNVKFNTDIFRAGANWHF
jgi:opacity protein-like surface antigen